jgi:hypothetical protein
MKQQKLRFKVGDRVVYRGMMKQHIGTVVGVPKILRSGYSVQIDGDDGPPRMGIDEGDLRLCEQQKSLDEALGTKEEIDELLKDIPK